MRMIPPIPAHEPQAFSWWQHDLRATTRVQTLPPLAGDNEADVVIVGGGFTGMWTAITLKERSPRLRIALLDANRCGDGASSRNGGNVHGYWSALPALVPIVGAQGALEAAALATLAQRKIGTFARSAGRDVWWVEEGYLRVATSQAQLAKLTAFVDTAQDLGVPGSLQRLGQKDTAGYCGSQRSVAGILFAEGATVHPARLADAMRDAVIAAGIAVFEMTAALRIDEGAPNRVVTSGGTIKAREVVLANYTGTMAVPSVAASTTLFSSFPVMSAPNEAELDRIGYRVARGIADLRMFTYYFRRTRDGRVLMGSGSGPIAFGRRDRTACLRNDMASSRRAAQGLKHFFPGIAAGGTVTSWGWPIDVSADRLPFFGTLAGTRVHYGSGYSGHGVNATCIAGECLASLALGSNDRWSNSPFCKRTQARFPPEPFRYIGGRIIRGAIVTCEDAEDNGERRPIAARAVAQIPRLLGMRIGTR